MPLLAYPSEGFGNQFVQQQNVYVSSDQGVLIKWKLEYLTSGNNLYRTQTGQHIYVHATIRPNVISTGIVNKIACFLLIVWTKQVFMAGGMIFMEVINVSMPQKCVC